MKIAIISDTHNNWANLKKAIEWIKSQNIEMILHCGDIMSQEIIDQSINLFGDNIKFVQGNADYDISNLKDKMEIKFNKKRIAFTHFPDIAKKLAQSGNYDLVFYGHTHRAWDEKIGYCHMVNPGELAGQFYKPTFAVYNTDTEDLELKILEML